MFLLFNISPFVKKKFNSFVLIFLFPLSIINKYSYYDWGQFLGLQTVF